ncbi:MAG TPA: neutral/alkaline non-lysosomal ceramidase N-terminal domain-containing protein, partial [Planctomycetota bacterium]|nr:neutral/alkaline non-lysosomal ceramidase N-terminal domain-containing protein [Planctomycetota bacterium]
LLPVGFIVAGAIAGWSTAGDDTRAVSGAESSAVLRAGAARVDVTPEKLPVRVAGNISESWADKVHDPLHVRALVLDDGKTRIALAVVDTCLMDRALIDEAKRLASKSTGIPAARMLVSATHTHSAPAVVGIHGTDPHLDYRELLISRIAVAIERANERLAPAEIGYGVGRTNEFVHCRRWILRPGAALQVPFTGRETNQAQMNPGHENPNNVRQTGPVDDAVTVLGVRHKGDGRPLAFFASYSTHYAGAPGVSADYFGAFAREIETRLSGDKDTENDNGGPEIVAMLANGTSGDANAIDFSRPRRPFDRFEVAREVARVALEAWEKIEWVASAPIVARERHLRLSVRMPTTEEVAAAEAFLAEKVGDRPVRTWEENYARETVLLSKLPDTRELVLQGFRIGELGVAAIPCEVYGSTGLWIKSQSPLSPTVVIGLANGYDGYLPPPEQFELGGYTTWRARSSCLEKDAEPKVARTVIDLLREAERERRYELVRKVGGS